MRFAYRELPASRSRNSLAKKILRAERENGVFGRLQLVGWRHLGLDGSQLFSGSDFMPPPSALVVLTIEILSFNGTDGILKRYTPRQRTREEAVEAEAAFLQHRHVPPGPKVAVAGLG